MPYKDPVKRREYHNAYNKRWHAANPEKQVQYNRKYTAANDLRPGELGYEYVIPPLERLMAKVEKQENECWLWTGQVRLDGYGAVAGCSNRVRYRWSTHRLSWTIHHGIIPEGMCVLHRCDVRLCVNPDHLFLGTHQDNIADMISKGRAWFQKEK